VTPTEDQGNEVSVHGEVDTISGDFQREDAPPPSERSTIKK